MSPELTGSESVIFSFGYCAFMLVLALVFLKFPPKKINSLYGYRTERSMRNEVVWEAANNYWTKLFVKLNIAAFVIPAIVYYIYPAQIVLITVIASTMLLLATIPLTEKYLNKNFDKDGNRN